MHFDLSVLDHFFERVAPHTFRPVRLLFLSTVPPQTSDDKQRSVVRSTFCLVVIAASRQLTISCGNVNAVMESASAESLQSCDSLQTSAFAGNETKTSGQKLSPAMVSPSKSDADDRGKRSTLTSEHDALSHKKMKQEQTSLFKSDVSRFEELFTLEGLDKEFKMTRSAVNGNATTDPGKKIAIVVSDLKKASIQTVLSSLNVSYASSANKPELVKLLTDAATLVWMLLNTPSYHSAELKKSL